MTERSKNTQLIVAGSGSCHYISNMIAIPLTTHHYTATNIKYWTFYM